MVSSHVASFLGDSSPLNDASWTLHLPVSMDELRAEVLEGWDAGETFDFHLRRAAVFRGEGIGCLNTDPERAFVALFRAANLLLVKLTTHPDYEFILNDSEREALFSTGETTFRELGELKKRILERQNERAAAQQATFINHSTPMQSTIKRLPSFVRANAYNENHRWAPENTPLGLPARGYPSPPPSSVTSPLQGWNSRPPTPNGPRAPSMAQPSPRRNSIRNHPPPLRHFAGTPMPAPPQEGRLNLLRRCVSFAQLPLRPSELNLRHPSPLSSPRSPSWPPGSISRIPLNHFTSPRTRLESLRQHQDRHPLRPNSSANVNPIRFEIKKKMKERRKACHDHSTSDSSAKFDSEEYFSSLTTD